MEYEKPRLAERIQEVLNANFPEWIWKLKKGDLIGVFSYQGSWYPPGTREYFKATFIGIWGNQVWYYMHHAGLDKPFNPLWISSTQHASSIKTLEEYEKCEAEILDYREKHPDWASAGM